VRASLPFTPTIITHHITSPTIIPREKTEGCPLSPLAPNPSSPQRAWVRLSV
jgi:hypothetical protein